jgi:hypothetical protein
MVDYKQPRRLNSVTIVLLIGMVAAGYWFWRFFPAYFDAWTVDHILKEAASKVYRANRMREPERTQELNGLLDKARSEMQHKASVNDPELLVNLDFDGNNATLTADYRVVITHPVISRTTLLHFVRRQTADIKTVSWE